MVEKLLITDIPNIDAIAVMIEDFGSGMGKITITCDNDCWTNIWGAMGKENTMMKFFSKCNTPYLIDKMKSGLRAEIDDDDEEVLTTALRKQIIEDRKAGIISADCAFDLWDRSVFPMENHQIDGDLFFEVFGDDWWHCIPKKPNREYEHLGKVIDIVKEAFKIQMIGNENDK